MGTNSKLSAASAALALSVLATSTLAFAKPVTVYAPIDEDRLTERVSYADLNLASTAGQRTLNFRVERASSNVCQPFAGRGLAEWMDFRACRTEALDGAKPQVDLAIQRAMQIAANGTSTIPPVAISIVSTFGQ